MSRDWWIVVGVQIALSMGIGAIVTFAIRFMTPVWPFETGQRGPETKKLSIGWFYAGALFCLAVFAIADAVIAALPYLVRGYVYVLGLMGVQVTQTLVAAVVVVIGYAAYRFKKAMQISYGLLEVGFAAASVIVALKTTPANNWLGLATALVGAMYVVSRGVGNFYEAKEKAARLGGRNGA